MFTVNGPNEGVRQVENVTVDVLCLGTQEHPENLETIKEAVTTSYGHDCMT